MYNRIWAGKEAEWKIIDFILRVYVYTSGNRIFGLDVMGCSAGGTG